MYFKYNQNLCNYQDVDFDIDLNHTFKIGYGPNALINLAPYRACAHLNKEIKQIKNATSIDVYLFNELARSVKETRVNEDILAGLKPLNLPVKFFTNKKPNEQQTHPLTFELVIRGNNRRILHKYTIFSSGLGSYNINGVEEPNVYTHMPFSRALEWTKNHPQLSYFDIVSSFLSKKFVTDNYEKCIKIMDKLIDDGLKAEGKLPLDYLGVTYYAKAKKIYKNRRPKETDDQKMIRLVSAYAYAIGEQNVLKRKFVASPTGSTCPVVWSVLRYLRETYHPTKEQIYNALSASCLICDNVEFGAKISANEGGCQSAMATATAMATAIACVIIYNADYEEIGRACEMAIEHTLGLICNSVCAVPIVPCIQRTASFAVRAVELAILNHSLMKTKPLVTFDDAVLVLSTTGFDLTNKYKTAGTEGFAKTARYSLFPKEAKNYEWFKKDKR